MKIEDVIRRYESWAEDDRIDVLIRKEHRQMADWLKELKTDRPQGEWIPCGERLPSGTDTVLVSTCAFNAIYDVVFMMAKDVERFYECGYVNAWMPSPEPWKGADDE